jgi:hypothetical protein
LRIRTLIIALLLVLACVPAFAASDNSGTAPRREAEPASASPSPEPAVSPEPTATSSLSSTGAFSLKAHRIAFYSARYILTGDGDVEVKLADGARVTGSRFAMDIRLNRFVVAGNVKLYALGHEYDGAAFSDYFDFDRQYFVPVTDEPDRWTYAHGEYGQPYRGREMPGDTFFLPDVSRDKVFIYAQKCVVQPRESIKFITPTINFGLAYIPWPSFFVNFTANPNFAQNSMPGAFIDGPYDAFGGGHGLFTLNLRYDRPNGVYLAPEFHQVSDKHYIVGSVSPFTRPFKQYNFDVYDRISPKMQVQASFQESAFQLGLHTPLAASAYSSLALTGGLPNSYLQLVAHQYWTSLLAQPAPGINGLLYYFDPTHNWIPNHPNDIQLTWNGFRHRINKLPVYFTLRSGIGVAHEGYGLQFLGGVESPTIWNKTVGVNVTAPSLTLIKDESGFRRDIYLNLSLDKTRTWYDTPHHIDISIVNGSISRQFDRHFAGLFGYTNQNIGDYWGARQNEVYPLNQSYFSPVTNQIYPSYGAFQGLGTTRSLFVQMNYVASTSFAASVNLRKNHDFPEAVPGVFPAYGALSFQNYGNVPNQATVEVRFRLSPILVLDFQDAYFFNFGGVQKWSPNFQFQALR